MEDGINKKVVFKNICCILDDETGEFYKPEGSYEITVEEYPEKRKKKF